MRLEGRTAIITGGAGGIGAASARALAAEGAQVAVLDVDEGGERVAEEVGGRFERCDVAVEAEVAAAARRCAESWGRVDVLVNVAGIEQTSAYDRTTVEEWDRILDVNLRGAWLTCKHVAPGMVAAGRGSIVNVSSTNGLVGSLAGAAYGASKGGLVILTKDLAIELARTGVRVNAVCPGTIDTPLLHRWVARSEDPERAWKILARSMPVGRLGTPQEVAAAVLFLASDESSLCTGVALPVDGGLTAQ